MIWAADVHVLMIPRYADGPPEGSHGTLRRAEQTQGILKQAAHKVRHLHMKAELVLGSHAVSQLNGVWVPCIAACRAAQPASSRAGVTALHLPSTATPLARRLSLVPAGLGQPVRELSGRNQQKVTVAGALASDPV
jgi:hypothetical protein